MIVRPFYLEQLRRWREKDVVKVLTGIRRCGKSTLLSMFREELRQSGVPKENIISLNLEGIEGIDITVFASGESRQSASVEKRQFGSAEIRQFESIEKSQS